MTRSSKSPPQSPPKSPLKSPLKQLGQKLLPKPANRWLKKQLTAYRYSPPLGKVAMGDLKGLRPINPGWGFERGQPIDRYYIENFLAQRCEDIRGHALAVGDDYYTQRFGGDRLSKSDVLHIENVPQATIVADLTYAPHIPDNTFDCFLLVQTLQLIYQVRQAVHTTYRILKPGGVVLATFPGITPLKDEDWNQSWCWNFTQVSAQKLFAECFPAENIEIETHGNVLAATAFLHGLARTDLSAEQLDYCDPRFPVILTVRAVKPSEQ